MPRDRLRLVQWHDNALHEVSADGSSVSRSADLGTSLRQLVVDPEGSLVYVTDRATATLSGTVPVPAGASNVNVVEATPQEVPVELRQLNVESRAFTLVRLRRVTRRREEPLCPGAHSEDMAEIRHMPISRPRACGPKLRKPRRMPGFAGCELLRHA